MQALLLELADVADGLSLPAWDAGSMNVTTKPDGSPVTDIDIAIETALRALLSDRRPADGFLGEELGGSAANPGDGTPTWIVDGIDGTRAFTSGSPAWSTHIALVEDDGPVAGVVTCPALARRWVCAEPGKSFAVNPEHATETLGVSATSDIATGAIARWPLDRPVKPEYADYNQRIAELVERGQDIALAKRRTVSTCAMLVAQGELDAFVMFGGQSWDHAAPAAVVEGAGGRFSCLDGSSSLATGAGVYSNGHIHDQLLEVLVVPR